MQIDTASLTSADITQIIYLHDIRALEQGLAKYLRFKDEVWVLFDNLDKGWSAGGVSDEDIVILRCLIDAAKKMRNELVQKKLDFHAVVFIRNDVFELLMEGTADYGKERRANLDWTDRRQLVELLMRRLEYGYRGFRNMPAKDIWPAIFADGREPSSSMDIFLDHSLLRPRNLIQLFQHCKGFAVNVGHERISAEDVARALDAYSIDLVTEINREIGDVFPQAPRVLYELAHETADLSRDDLIVLGELKGLSQPDSERLVDLLFYYAVIGVPEADGKTSYIYDTQYDMECSRRSVVSAAVRPSTVFTRLSGPRYGLSPRRVQMSQSSYRGAYLVAGNPTEANGAGPNGLSYRAHPRLYHRVSSPRRINSVAIGGIADMPQTLRRVGPT